VNARRAKKTWWKHFTLAPLANGARVFARRGGSGFDWYEGQVEQVKVPNEGEPSYKVKFDDTGKVEDVGSRENVSDKVWEGFCLNPCCHKIAGNKMEIGPLPTRLSQYKPRLQHTENCDFSHLRLGITLKCEVGLNG
jgi:hypothetical protein